MGWYEEAAAAMIIYMMITGWLFDVYPLGNKMVIWIKQKDGSSSGNSIVRLEDTNWNYSLYVSADDKSDLVSILKQPEIIEQVKEHEFVLKHERITDNEKSNILKLKLRDPTKALTLAKKIERLDSNFGKLRLYNVDLSPSQLYFYEHDIFPLAFCKACSNSSSSSSSSHSKLSWNNKDDAWSVDYQIPDFKTIHMSLNLKNGEGKMMMPQYTDRISSIRIKQQDSDIFEIQSESEADIIENLIKVVKKIDPDFIFTEDGDSFTFPYLIHRAEINNTDLFLGREESIPLRKPTREGTSYFSYGQVYFKPATIKLLGRIHLDKSNSFLVNETAAGLHGLYEIARICRMPLHTASRASIGKCLSSLQFYYATTQKDTLIPWKPVTAEHFKSLQELLVADRGGFIFEPEIGVHENVAEFDFVSLYPNIMFKKNLSAETINCSCCCRPNSDLKVPELLAYYHICSRRTGIVPLSLNIVLQKRAKYKQLLLQPNISSKLKTIYYARQNSLKWILVTSFGYLGFNNAKFGRIDAHIAVCAFGRQILLQAAKIAERHGFRVLHGIVDSLWVKKEKEEKYTIVEKQEDEEEDDADNYLELKQSIEKETGFAISFEGIYKWIAFVPSKRNDILPVANRYFGAFEDGSLKIRGIEARRHDTPPFLSKCQEEILQIMAKGNNIKEVKLLMPKVKSTYQKYIQLLKDGRLPIEDLVFTKQLSKDATEYNVNRNTVEKDAIVQLCNEGKYLKAGQTLRYIIIDYYYHNRKHSKCKRAIPIELINKNDTTYDIKRYSELLTNTCNSVTKPFGYSLSS